MKKYDGIPIPKRVYQGRPIKHDFGSMEVGQCVYYEDLSKADALKDRKIINASAHLRGYEITTRVQQQEDGKWKIGVWMNKKPE